MPTAAGCMKIRAVASEALWRRVVLGAAVVALAGMASAGRGRRAGRLGLRAAACRPGLRRRRPAGARAAARTPGGTRCSRSPGGPTYDGVRAPPAPADAGRQARRAEAEAPDRLRRSTTSRSASRAARDGAGVVQLHVADGSQVVSRRVDGSKLTVFVGRRGKERYGSCLSRLETPRLAQGYLPILETGYTDADGVRYRQESFAARIPQTRALVSFIRLSVDPSGARVRAARIRFTPSVRLHRVGHQLRQGRRARLLFGKNLRFDGESLVTTVRRPRAIYLAWLDRAAGRGRFRLEPGDVRARARERSRTTGQAARDGRRARRPGAARLRRRAQPADPEPDAVLALQPRERLRALLLGAARTWPR